MVNWKTVPTLWLPPCIGGADESAVAGLHQGAMG